METELRPADATVVVDWCHSWGDAEKIKPGTPFHCAGVDFHVQRVLSVQQGGTVVELELVLPPEPSNPPTSP
jgi:hypothetical protein